MGLHVDVDLMSQCIVVLKKILEQESKGWYIKYKDRLITELKGVKLICSFAFDFDFCCNAMNSIHTVLIALKYYVSFHEHVTTTYNACFVFAGQNMTYSEIKEVCSTCHLTKCCFLF